MDDARHQPGIATPPLAHLALGAFDFQGERAADLRDLLRAWSAATARLMAAERLTLTVGLGAALFGERLGLGASRPAALVALPAFAGDALDPARSGGDLCAQACAEEPHLAVQALRALAGLAAGVAVARWAQAGFQASGGRRNLMGFREGAGNLRAPRDLERHVWVRARDRTWMVGGTYLVYRRIRLRLDAWEALGEGAQELAVGRRKATGAGLRERRAHDDRPRPALPADGPLATHAALATPAANGGAAMLRRGYSYFDGVDREAGGLDAGLLFLAFQRDPRRQFVPVQRRLAAHDPLAAHTVHTAGAVFAIPPGVRPGGFLAEGLFAGVGA
jgi:deferrochelatase/peroxidase EfeB